MGRFGQSHFYLSGDIKRFFFKVHDTLGHEREGYGEGGRKPKSGCNHSSFNYQE